jgi:RNA polymerase sigma-70 factor (ECF subfamily)
MKKDLLQPSNWVALHGDYLYSIAMLKTGNEQTAQDLVQDTFLSAIKAKDSFAGNSSERTWLTVILNNKVIDYYRKKDVLKNADDYLADTDASFHQHFFETDPAQYGHWKADAAPQDWGQQADRKLLQQEFQRILRYCISKLPTKLVPAFMAKFVDDQDAEKICKDLQISSSNYWVMIHRAKVLMRTCLEKNGLT